MNSLRIAAKRSVRTTTSTRSYFDWIKVDGLVNRNAGDLKKLQQHFQDPSKAHLHGGTFITIQILTNQLFLSFQIYLVVLFLLLYNWFL
jgi:hypothetical protein